MDEVDFKILKHQFDGLNHILVIIDYEYAVSARTFILFFIYGSILFFYYIYETI